MMEWAAWAAWDAAIRAEFGYAADEDRASALLLRGHATDAWASLDQRIRGRAATVVCCGPGLADVDPDGLGRPIVAADGATSHLRRHGVVPDVVVTDLDGEPEALRWAADEGAVVVVHAHGDNREAVARLGAIAALGTHQVEPEKSLAPLRNLGGFTDGDRAVLMCEQAGATAVHLVAFEPLAPPGAASHRWDPATKPRKLAWAHRIVTDAAQRMPVTGLPPGGSPRPATPRDPPPLTRRLLASTPHTARPPTL